MARTMLHTPVSLLDRTSADLSVAAILMAGNRFLFAIQPQSRWRRDSSGTLNIAFGGIGGKVEPDEGLIEALKRECEEEISVGIEIISNPNRVATIDPDELGFLPSTFDLGIGIAPAFIFMNPPAEKGRSKPTNVFAFLCTVSSGNLKPRDNPAVIGLDRPLLHKVISGRHTLRDALQDGAKLIEFDSLPRTLPLSATPTPRGIDRYLDSLTEREASALFGIVSRQSN